MNSQVVKLFGLIVVMFAVLIGFTSYWSVFDAEALKDKRVNKRPLLEQQQIRRGRILADDGTVIAKSIPKGHGTALRYVRRYPEGGLFGHPIGYSFVEKGDSEFEKFHNDELVGNENEFASIIDELAGKAQEGDDIVSTIDPPAQELAMQELSQQGAGAVVALEPQTGKVRVMASFPPYDPNRIPEELPQLSTDPNAPLVDRATQGQYPPGSTFKVVTAAAGLDSGTITPETTINAPGVITVQGQPLQNDFTQDFGPISLDPALTDSVNTWFAQLGERVGSETLYNYMSAFGFNSKPQIDLPSDQLTTSGIYDGDQLLGPNDPIDVARVAIGQERLLVTPLQMAEVAAAVANDGTLMKPRLWDRVVDPDGRVVKRMDPSEQSQAISPESAQELNDAMQSVVREGTGTAAALAGVDVAGKTGTAEVPDKEACNGLPNQAWFIGFAPADDPQIAVAATIECTSGFGGEVAAPIVADVMQELLSG
jgi:peptidoglycan glycosyltransferase